MKTAFAAGLLTLAGAGAVLGGWTSSTTAATETMTTATAERGETVTYGVDPVHSNVLFKIRHAGVSNFYGQFQKFTGEIEFDKADFTASSVSFEIDVESVSTDNSKRDEHIKGADFFNARQYPKTTFKSTSITDNGDGTYSMTGDMTLFGQTKSITAIVADLATGTMRGTPILGFEATFQLKRSDWGMTKYLADDGGEGGALGNTVSITVAVEADAG